MARPRREVPWFEKREDNGVYYAFWYDAEERRTRRMSLGTRDPGEAQTAFARFLTEGRDIIRGVDRLPDLTVKQAVADYLDEHARFQVTDPVHSEQLLRALVQHFDDRPLAEIGEADCRVYADARRRGDYGRRWVTDTTVHNELRRLRTVANHAIRKKRLAPDRAPTIVLPKLEQRRAPWLTHDDLQRLHAAAEAVPFTSIATVADFIGLCYPLAARRRVIEALEWEQVDLANWQIHLAKEGWRPTKKRRPTVPIFDEMVPVLDKLRAKRYNHLVFGEIVDAYEPMMKAGRRVKLKTNPHILRHSRATHLLQEGADIYDVARLLGDNVTTVDRIYGHHSPASMRRKLSGFSSALSSVARPLSEAAE